MLASMGQALDTGAHACGELQPTKPYGNLSPLSWNFLPNGVSGPPPAVAV